MIKSGGKEIPDETMKEASEFSAANSKAWAKGMGTVDVFAVRPEQLSKASPEGINLPKGSFYVSGERAWFKDREIKLAVGVKIEETEDEDGRPMRQALVLSGPVLAMRKNTQYFITIQPGFKKSIELSEDIRKKLLIRASPEDKPLIEAVDRDDFVKAIPSGMGDIVEYG